MRKVLPTMIGTLSIATAMIAHPAVTRVAKDSPSAAVDAGCSQARILEPGSRSNVVEI